MIRRDDSEITLHIDEPELLNGKATRTLEGTLVIKGWAISQSGISSVEFALDEHYLGTGYYGIRREDVAQTFPHVSGDNALLSGFGFSVPHRFLTEGEHRVTIIVNTKANTHQIIQFDVQIGAIGEQAGPWLLRKRLSPAEALFTEHLINSLAFRPWFYICVTCQSDQLDGLSLTVDSIMHQCYSDWTIVLNGDEHTRASIMRLMNNKLAALDKWIFCSAEATTIQSLVSDANPRDLLLPIEAGDLLAVDALFCFATALSKNDKIDFLYADERKYNVATNQEDAFFKPDWSPVLLLSTNYIGRPWCATATHFMSAAPDLHPGDRSAYDLVLRLTELASQIEHVRRILLQRAESKSEAPQTEYVALDTALRRRGLPWEVTTGLIPNTYQCRPRSYPDNTVSIIIPTCATRGLIASCLQSIKAISTYKNIELICVENISEPNSKWKTWLRETCDVTIEIDDAFNWSRFNNLAAREASGSYLLFLNDDIEVIQPDWLERLLDIACIDDVGLVGPQLLYPDRKVQHAGMFLTKPGIARHAFRFCSEDDPGYFGLALTRRDVMAITGACMLMKRSTYELVGGFDESHAVVNNDVDFCLKLNEKGLKCVYTPFARLIHHELASRKNLDDLHDAAGFSARWSDLLSRGDPFFHPDLDQHSDIYQATTEPMEQLFSGTPRLVHNSIKRILAVKVDHIGDFIAAFPAFRRLKQHFPNAELVVLTSPSSVHLAKLEPAIDHTILFEFFHTRSQLGPIKLSRETLTDLTRKLTQYQFDLAVDLRKQSETRFLLKCSGARFTAGFDYQNEHPWLDIATTFEGDIALIHKRQHISASLINLVDMIAQASDRDHVTIIRTVDWPNRQIPIISKLAGLYGRRLVCIHPAAGNDMKQWPISHYAYFIKSLLDTEDVNFAIIGTEDDAKLSESLLALLPTTDRIFNLVGTLTLEELPYFLDSCALFVGNDSAPKHIAAGVGVPTVGIQSGVVDAQEWGPLGDLAITIRRNVVCSPCYRAKPELCHRGLACLTDLLPTSVIEVSRNLLRLERGIKIS